MHKYTWKLIPGNENDMPKSLHVSFYCVLKAPEILYNNVWVTPHPCQNSVLLNLLILE